MEGTAVNQSEDYLLNDSGFAITVPPPTARLTIAPGFDLETIEPMPSAWHRFWQRFLLGWQWQSLDADSTSDPMCPHCGTVCISGADWNYCPNCGQELT